jgi:predicted MFS family arabinose efflux permease
MEPMRTLLTPSDWGQRHRTLAVCIGAYFGVRFCQVLVGSVVPGIISTFGVSRGTVGLGLTGMWVVYALVQVPSGVFADRFGERTVVTAALLLTALATIGLAGAPAFAVVVVAVAAIGAGAGIYYNPATTLLDRTAGPIGRAIGFHRTGGQLAGVLAPASAALVGLRYGWRETVVLGSICVAIVAVAFLHSTRSLETSQRAESTPQLFDTDHLSALLTRPGSQTTLMMTLVEFVGVVAMAFLPTMFLESHGVGQTRANLLFALFFGIGAVSQPIAGWLSDRYGRDRTIAVLAVAGLAGYGGLAVGGPIAFLGLATALAGMAMSSTPVIQSRMLDGLAPDERGAGFGVFRSVYLLLGASGTAVIGTVADGFGWAPAVGLLSLLFGTVLAVSIASDSPGPT